MTYLPVSENDREMVRNLMKQGATEEEAWQLVDDQYEETDKENR